MDELVSEIIIKTTEDDPRTNLLAMLALEAQLDIGAENGDGYEQFVIGSVADLSIKPLLRCDNDINIMSQSTREIAIPIGCKIPDDDYLRRLNKTNILLYRMQPTQDPGYVRLLTSGSLDCVPHTTPARFVYKPDSNSGIFVQRHKTVSTSTTIRRFQYSSAVRTNHLKMHEMNFVISSESLKSIPCPYWSSNDFCERPKPYNCPTKDTISEIVRKGCDLVLASDVNGRNRFDTTQWRLSFSRGETVLIQTWTPEQKIVYHLLRYLRKKCLPFASLISSYHIKTLLLWICEKQPHDYWKANVITIVSDLLGRLVKHIKNRSLPNYFIPQSNLFDVRTDEGDSFGSSYVAVVATLTPFTRTEVMAKWFLENYIKVAAKQFYGSQSANIADDLVFIEHLSIADLMAWLTAFVDTFLSDFEQHRAMEASLSVNNYIRRLVELCARGKLVPGFCRQILDRLPQIDIRSLDFFRSVIFMEAASQTDQFGFIPGKDSIGTIVEVLIRSGKLSRSKFDQRESDSASSYFNKATSLLHFVKCSTAVDDKLLLALSKAYFWTSLLCTDSGAVYCAVNAYLAAIFYQGKETKLALYCCTLIASKDNHLSCSGHTIQPQLLPIINTVLSTSTSTFKTEKESRDVPQKAACKPKAADPLTPELFANRLLSKINVESEHNRFDEDADTSSFSGNTSDENYIYSQFSTEEAKTQSSSSSNIASKKTLGMETRLENTDYGISSNVPQDVFRKSGETDSQECTYSPSYFVSDYGIENCVKSEKSTSDEFSFVSKTSRPESEKFESPSSTGKSGCQIKSEHECRYAVSNISTKTSVYVRTESKDICQKCQDEHGDLSLTPESDMHSKGTVENKPKAVKPQKSGKEMVYCRDQLNLNMNTRLGMRSPQSIVHKPDAYSKSRKLKAVLYSRTDSQVCPPAESDPEHDTLKLKGKNFSNKSKASVDQSVPITSTDFSNMKKMFHSCRAPENLSNSHQLYGSVATTIRQDVVSALVKASVCHMTAFNKELQKDPDISQQGNCAYPYMALYHFNSGHFQAALEICNDIINQESAYICDATSFNLICSPPFDLLLSHELKMIVNEYRSSSEITTIEARFLAAYLSVECLMTLDRSVVDIARMLMMAYAIFVRSHVAFEEVTSRIYVFLREKVLQRYRGIITEDMGNDSLSVLENGVLTNVGIKYDGERIVLYTERHGGWGNKDLFFGDNENYMSYYDRYPKWVRRLQTKITFVTLSLKTDAF